MDVKAGRYTANYPDDFVVLFIGFRINHLWRVNEWVPIIRAAFTMTKEARALPDEPLLHSFTTILGSDPRTMFFIQYWRSFDALMSWPNRADLKHKPAQRAFYKRTAYNGHVGVWHETYKVEAGQFETIYANMPRMGLAAAGTYRELRESSRGYDRMGNAHAH